jgi:putative SOS response-associated peptidase YedK
VPADFLYEWQQLGLKAKQPYAIELKDQPVFAFAGLWDSWKDRTTGQRLETYSIVTTDPNEAPGLAPSTRTHGLDTQSNAGDPRAAGL